MNLRPASLRPLLAAFMLPLAQAPLRAQAPGVEALIYSTMPSTSAHRPEMALDGDPGTYFKSVYGMSEGDDFLVLLSRPVPLRWLRITTGDADGQDLLGDAAVEISADGATYRKAAAFDKAGVAQATLNGAPVRSLRIKLNRGKGVPALLIREISLGSPARLAHVQLGPGRGFADISQAPDLAGWAARAEREMEEFWPDAQALLYSPGFITPNKVNVVYRTGPGVTDVAATGGGVMTVNSAWCRKRPDDTGLTVHEMAHVVQAMGAYNPVWLIEGCADYIRWVGFEPQNHHPGLNPATATYHDSYRTTATFLAWCQMHYDSTLVTQLNHAIRFGNYKPELWQQFTGKDVDALWAEFLAAYKADPVNIITTPLAQADRPRALPLVKAGSSVPVDLAASFDAQGFAKDGTALPANGGFDGEGASLSAALLGASQTWNGVRFNLGPAQGKNIVSGAANAIALPAGKYLSLWILGASVEGSQMAQSFTVNYADGTSDNLVQNMSDWFQPRSFVGESRAVKMPYRNTASGARDERTFYAYSYGLALNPTKTVRSLQLPNNPNVKILAVTLAN